MEEVGLSCLISVRTEANYSASRILVLGARPGDAEASQTFTMSSRDHRLSLCTCDCRISSQPDMLGSSRRPAWTSSGMSVCRPGSASHGCKLPTSNDARLSWACLCDAPRAPTHVGASLHPPRQPPPRSSQKLSPLPALSPSPASVASA